MSLGESWILLKCLIGDYVQANCSLKVQHICPTLYGQLVSEQTVIMITCIDCITFYMHCPVLQFGFLVAALEWLTFVCTHQCHSEWKKPPAEAPVLVKAVMAHSKSSLLVVARCSCKVYRWSTNLFSLTFKGNQFMIY